MTYVHKLYINPLEHLIIPQDLTFSKFFKLFNTFLSIEQKQVLGWKFKKKQLGLVNNHLTHYKDYWLELVQSLKHHNIFDSLNMIHTFRSKLNDAQATKDLHQEYKSLLVFFFFTEIKQK